MAIVEVSVTTTTGTTGLREMTSEAVTEDQIFDHLEMISEEMDSEDLAVRGETSRTKEDEISDVIPRYRNNTLDEIMVAVGDENHDGAAVTIRRISEAQNIHSRSATPFSRFLQVSP